MEAIARIAPVLGAYDRCDLPAGFWEKRTNRAFQPRALAGGGKHSLGWSVEQRGDASVITPSGRIDTVTANEFTERLLDEVLAAPAKAAIDLSEISFMSSHGLRALTLAQRAARRSGITLVLARPDDAMREILAISHYDTAFTVAQTMEEALAN